ncbi:hypothetical protein GCM10009630_37070 [Kribbella jejuensis]|uniref:Uncharacterized protein n=1 Tax=Kribbella jejuensis TaxID=236068 RepID=A0A542ESM0_9ACTN|nr:hypothetical protein [Kribbella jejuensis]TQJ18341.1 hypothetical protein FB475_2476 [Kribbella jejuensis]
MRPASFEEFMRVQHLAAINVTGADHSSWNGTYDVQPYELTDDGKLVLGSAGWDHTIRYDEERVLRPLREMFRYAGQQVDDATLLRYREALAVVYHENLHLLAGPGTEHADAQQDFRIDAVRAFEEGVTESYGHETLDDYIDELQLDLVAPGIKNVIGLMAYERFTPAAETLAYELGTLDEADRLEILRRMVVVNATGKWTVAAGIIADRYGLGAPHFATERVIAERRITNAMWKHFGKLPGLSIVASHQLFSRSAAVGHQAFEEAREIAGEYFARRISFGGVASPARGTSGWGTYSTRSGPPQSLNRRPEPPDLRP